MSENRIPVICKDSTYDVMLHHAAHIPWDGTWRVIFEKIEEEPEESPKPKRKSGLKVQQRKALHKGLRFMAEALSDAGYSVQTAFTLPVAITMENVKDGLLKRYMMVMFPDIESTEELTSTQLTDLWEKMNQALGETKGLEYIPFPHEKDDE